MKSAYRATAIIRRLRVAFYLWCGGADILEKPTLRLHS